jgi:uncharacterized protein
VLDPNVTDLASTPSASPDYVGLVKFLLQPFLESPESLKVDCEISPRRSRVLIRLAFEGEDRGRVFGRGGRNIQAIRSVLQAIAQTCEHSVHLEIYGGQPATDKPPSREHSPREHSPREYPPKERREGASEPRSSNAPRPAPPRPRKAAPES